MELDGYRPGALAGIVALHARYYAREWNFGLAFEAKVASELAEFLQRLDVGRDFLLVAYQDGEAVASIVVDVSGGGEGGAHLRWFVVGDAARGRGLGRDLLRRATRHCDALGCRTIWLTTFAGLHAARKLYEDAGFALVSESAVDQWSGGVREQRFERSLPPRDRD
ncbi:MAG: GNAT family N-acetyltransferase [Rhizobiaceae bacterium]|nr:GNAT family N-acetyltransferase [Rhizobiaceae bacterium]